MGLLRRFAPRNDNHITCLKGIQLNKNRLALLFPLLMPFF